MSDQHSEASDSEQTSPPPTTGNRLVDAALAEFGDLSQHPPTEHHDRLSQVADVLSSVLENSRDGVQTPIPGLPPQRG
ncbi:hypothetical protein [Aestuariimicrobium ganziense]|uniref:hypothetical protein n=1 Tax=Aestuariimicrobium ganziense TaxID=2773677 RepID=UPI001943D95A|nr:hypothetical protein [Aestuariimicrobium ganziense]